MTFPRYASSIFGMLLAGAAACGQTTPSAVTQARALVEKKPDIYRRIGLAEVLRSHGLQQAGLEEMHKAAGMTAPGDPVAAEVQALVCWRMMPLPDARREDFRTALVKLAKLAPDYPWLPFWQRYLFARADDRGSLLMAKGGSDAPGPFPLALAEKAHGDLLRELGWSRLQAGIEVIAARSYEPLHALRDLDRVLSREADFLGQSQRPDDAKKVLAVRDRDRQAYARASKHLVEKLFALNLLGKVTERDALLSRAEALPYLHDRKRLASLLERFDDDQAWKLLIEPLLTSELALIEQPPDLTTARPGALVQLQIQARKKTMQGKVAFYEGEVRAQLRDIEVSCAQLTVLVQEQPASALLTGAGKVLLRGIDGYRAGISADRFSCQTDTGAFSLGGNIRLQVPDKILKLYACTVTPQGQVRDARSRLDDFKNAFDVSRKVELLPAIAKEYDDAELPDDVRYMVALNLLRPHLTWRAPYLPPQRADEVKEPREGEMKRGGSWDDWRWQPALGGEEWMLAGIPQSAQDAHREAARAWYKRFNATWKNRIPPALPTPDVSLYFWRIRDPQHPDVARALRLLRGIYGELYDKARHWADEIARNNTVLTLDIAGAAAAGQDHAVLLDARNADSVSFKLYRVRSPDELLYAVNRIGKDFIYRDHGLGDGSRRIREDYLTESLRKFTTESVSKEAIGKPESKPAWQKDQLVHQWEAVVADLKAVRGDGYSRAHRRRHWDDDWYDPDPDADYFRDRDDKDRERIDKNYRPHREEDLSSWQCDRLVTIPGTALAKPGAYVLSAESNGQTVYVPIIVDPLSLTLRRCRDGVFVLAADADGFKSLAGATVHARGMIGEAATDKEGVAFARLFAAGDRPILVHHQGRYAIGGFGRVFEGIYYAPDEDDDYGYSRYWGRDRKWTAAREHEAAVYADRHVVIAYTDRPTYRPGQDVQFKLIVRKQIMDKINPQAAQEFRAEDFTAPLRLELPTPDQEINYEVLDPKGHVVADSTLKLNDFGTAAGKLTLTGEAPLGSYTFRLNIAGRPRLAPAVFAVSHYRRPNFEIRIAGVPDQIKHAQTLNLTIAGKYYFGSPVTHAPVEVRVQRLGVRHPVAQAEAKLDAKGEAKLEVPLPASMTAGKYVVVCVVTDESGRAVTKSLPLNLVTPAIARSTGGLGALPRFVPIGQELPVTTTEKEITVSEGPEKTSFKTIKGIATLRFSKAGWHHLQAGERARAETPPGTMEPELYDTSIFVYGGDRPPLEYPEIEASAKDDHDTRRHPRRWVNLSDINREEEDHLSRWEKPAYHLYALFDRQQANVGDKLRLLVYVPYPSAKLLFTLEGRTILDYAIQPVSDKTGPYQVVLIPIKDRYFPNVYLQGRILAFTNKASRESRSTEAKQALKRGEEREYPEEEGYDPRWCRIDVNKPQQHLDRPVLNVSIATDRADYRPGDPVRADIKVTDQAGHPQVAELSFAAVDESVFAFGEDGLDRLPGAFHRPQETRRFLPKAWRASIGFKWSAKFRLDQQAAKAQKDAVERLEIMKAQEASMN